MGVERIVLVLAAIVIGGSASLAQDWGHYGGDLAATRFAPLSEITPENVASLEVAWSYRTGDRTPDGVDAAPTSFQATPIALDGRLFLCTPRNIVIALDGATGREIWRYDPQADLKGVANRACRGVAAQQARGAVSCPQRIFVATLDARLIALDAETGFPCPGFGATGVVDLTDGMGDIRPGHYTQTSPPTVVMGRVIVGGAVMDNIEVGAPSGVVRAFDADTGALVWAWDIGRPDRRGAPGEGETYTRSTPNAWPPMSADPALGLVYVPTGAATPDIFGAHRTREAEAAANSLVALDVATGEARWAFQAVHHDLWDYDLPAQASLLDIDSAQGLRRVLILPTKQGQIFLLDRETGEPVAPVEERPAPQGAAPGDWTAPTQPISVEFPAMDGPPLTEKRMWGITPLDQLWCRIQFRRHRYEGRFTPPSLEGSIFHPSPLTFEWGGVAIDVGRGVMVANTTWMPYIYTLVPREEAARLSVKKRAALNPQHGTPYLVRKRPMMSPLGVPCLKPPWGHITGIDIAAGDIVWRKPFGDARDMGPFGLGVGVPVELGMFNIGGAIVTESGLTFIAATPDRRIRAYDVQTGAELWRHDLPMSGHATPMTYLDADGRQLVVIAAGGRPWVTPIRSGDHLIAFALPRAGKEGLSSD